VAPGARARRGRGRALPRSAAEGLSDAKRLGLSLEALRDAAGHDSVATTEGYLRGFEANRGLDLLKGRKAV
jgi:hypothetical protein